MPEKHPNSVRWGGPGASHEDRTKPVEEKAHQSKEGRKSVSHVSGGGGERDEKHSHVDNLRSSKSHATDSNSPTKGRELQPNAPRHRN